MDLFFYVMKKKIEKLLQRFKEVEDDLGNPEVLADQKAYKKLTQEHSYLKEISECQARYQACLDAIDSNKELIDEESDPEIVEMAKEELSLLEVDVEKLRIQLETLLVPPDPNDHANLILEIRAGTGGDEAAIFVGDCIRMYKLYSDSKGWKYELLSCTPSDAGGYKEYIMGISGQNAHRFLQYEAGTHRVQRVPTTETQGRVHTSAVTVAVIMEPGEEEVIDVDEKDLRIDTYRASGAGGQHVNTTDSAVRITHVPTGVVVYCQEERSQHKNKDKAMRVLKAKLVEEKRRKQQEEISSLRSSQVGSGDRSERIRTYNFPQNRITDHRIDLTLYKLEKVMQGDLEEITQGLVKYFYQEKLSS